MGKNVFKSFTDLDVAIHNARVAGGAAPAPTGVGADDEAELHLQIIEYCKSQRFYYVHSRMDRATTTALGVPDFLVAGPGGKAWWIEAKAKGKKLTREQEGTLHWLQALGHCAEVVYSFGQFLALINSDKDGQPNQATGEA